MSSSDATIYPQPSLRRLLRVLQGDSQNLRIEWAPGWSRKFGYFAYHLASDIGSICFGPLYISWRRG